MSPANANHAVGIIGLGIMGGAFARNLLKSGWKVVGCKHGVVRTEP